MLDGFQRGEVGRFHLGLYDDIQRSCGRLRTRNGGPQWPGQMQERICLYHDGFDLRKQFLGIGVHGL